GQAPARQRRGAAGGRRRGGDGRGPELARGRRRGAEQNRAVRKADVRAELVRRRVDRDRLDAELVQRADHAHRDLAAVRNQDTREHQRASSGAPVTGSSSNMSCPNSTGSAFSTWIARTTPAASAFTSFISFIASRMQSVCPCATASPTSTKGGAPGCGAR